MRFHPPAACYSTWLQGHQRTTEAFTGPPATATLQDWEHTSMQATLTAVNLSLDAVRRCPNFTPTDWQLGSCPTCYPAAPSCCLLCATHANNNLHHKPACAGTTAAAQPSWRLTCRHQAADQFISACQHHPSSLALALGRHQRAHHRVLEVKLVDPVLQSVLL